MKKILVILAVLTLISFLVLHEQTPKAIGVADQAPQVAKDLFKSSGNKVYTDCARANARISVVRDALETYKVKNQDNSLRALDGLERGSLKGCEIAKLTSVPRKHVSTYDIEIVSMGPIEGGVEVFARAWDAHGPIGFGADGSVEIERFRIINPPILVPDPTGDVVRVGKAGGDEDGVREFRAREDLEAALLLTLDHTIAVKKERHDASNIVWGKIGNTTSTFYPNAYGDAGSTTVDGRAEMPTNQTWAAKIAAAGTASDDKSAQENVVIYGVSGGLFTKLTRAIYLFDTSSIPDTDTISAATMSVYMYTKSIVGANSPAYNVYSSSPASNKGIAGTDYANLGSTDFSTAVAYSSISTVAYTDWALNASGLAAISQTGVTKLGVRESNYDVAAVSPPTTTGQTYVNGYYADQAGTTNDPKLVVEHTVAAPADDSYFIQFSSLDYASNTPDIL